LPAEPRKRARHEDRSWAKLMRYSFGLDVLGCPRCKKRLKLVAVILDRAEVERLLESLHLWSDPIPIRPARPARRARGHRLSLTAAPERDAVTEICAHAPSPGARRAAGRP
jgi:hypothetical protein